MLVAMDNFKYFNPNPLDKGEKKKWHKGDCVVRAFCSVLNRPWGMVFKDLCAIGAKKSDMPNSDIVSNIYAKENGLVKISLPEYMTLSNFAKKYDGIYVCRVRNHMTSVRNHIIYDTWNCGEYKVKTVFKKVK